MRAHPPAALSGGTETEAKAVYDPLRYCIFTTVVLIAWLITPPLALAIFGAIGVGAYMSARRRGLTKSRCLLGDTRLVVAYLGLLAVIGAGVTIWRLTSFL